MFLYLMYGISVLLGITASLAKIDKSLKRLLIILSFVILFVILGWSSGAYDVNIGIRRYNQYEYFSGFTEIGYTLLIRFFHLLNFSYRGFFVTCSFFELLAMFWFAKRNSDNSIIVILLFMIYPMVIFFQYSRNIAAFAIVLIAFDVLIHRGKHHKFIYCLLILIASLIHIDSLFFILYLPFSMMDKKVSVILTLIIFLILFMPSLSSVFFRFLERFLGEKKVDIVSGADVASGQIGRTLGIVIYLIEFWSIYLILKNVLKLDMDDNYSDFFFKMNLLSLLIIPLSLYYGVGFARFPVLLTFVNFSFYNKKISLIPNSNCRKKMYLYLFAFLFALLFINFRNVEYRELVLYPYFEENELINWLFGGDLS